MAISKFHKQADIKMNIAVNIDLTAVNNFYVLIEDTNSAVKKSFALNPEPPFNSDDITLIDSNTVEVRTHRDETADWNFGAYYYILFVSYDDADFSDAKRIESNSVIGFRLIRDIEPTTDPVDINTFIPGEGAGSFLELSDTPDDYTGQAGKVAMVNPTEDALIFYEASGIGDMTKAVYDPTGINADTFDYNNFYNTPTIPAPINDTDDLPEGSVNLYYTETRVSNNANVSANTTHRGQTNNPHNVTASQAGARPDTWVPAWGDVTGKPTEFPPESHNHPINEITNLQDELDNRRIGKELYAADINLEVGKYLHIAKLDDLSSASISGVIDSSFLAPAFTLNIFHVYDTVKYELGITHYSLAAEPQFDQLVFTQAANGDPIDVYFRIASIKNPSDLSNIALSANYTKTDNAVAGLTLYGELVDSVSDIELLVTISEKNFRATNVAPGVSQFLHLTDTPISYVGQAGNKVIVNDAEDGVEFAPDVEMGSIEVNYKWNTDINATEPDEGHLKGNNTDYSLITEIYISETDRNGKIRDGMLNAMDAGDVFIFRDSNSDTKFMTFIVEGEGANDNGSWWTIPVRYIKSGTNTFNDGERGIVGVIYLATKHFINLHDTPDDYTGHAGELVKVNAAEDGVEFDANTPVSTDTTFGGFRHTFDSTSGTLNLYTT